MRNPLPLPLDSKYHMFCFLILKQSRVCKIRVCFDLQKIPMLPLTDNWNHCNSWTFSANGLDVWSVGAKLPQKHDFLKFLLSFDVCIVL